MLQYSGVKQEQKAAGGVECIVKMDLVEKVTKWENISEIILIVELDIENWTNTGVVIVYAPNENETVSQNDNFWDELSGIIKNLKEKILLMGDFNSRVRQEIGTIEVQVKLVLDFCIEN